MSYTIVRSASVRKAADGTYYCRIVGCSNNIYPHDYHPWNCLEGRKTKDEVEMILLSDFANGGAKGGGSRYGAFIREIEAGVIFSPTMNRVRRLWNVRHRSFDKEIECRDKGDLEGKARYQKLYNYACKRADDILASDSLLKEFRQWKPDKRKYEIQLNNGGWVKSIGGYRFKYVHSRIGAKAFPAVTAYEFRNGCGKYEPQLFEVGRKSA